MKDENGFGVVIGVIGLVWVLLIGILNNNY